MRGWRSLAILLLSAICTLLLGFFALTPSLAQADSGSKHGEGQGPVQGTQTYVPSGTMIVPFTPTPTRWERVALSELADELGMAPDRQR